MHAAGDRTGVCGSCGAELAPMQRYCVDCGDRVAPRSSLLLALLRSRRSSRPGRRYGGTVPATAVTGGPRAAARTGTRDASPAAWLERTIGGLRLPAPPTAALLVLGFLGFGILIGDVAATKPGYALSAAARRPVKLILPAAPASRTSQGGAGAGESQPPPASSEATPEASESSATEPASKSSSSSSNGKESEGSSSGSGSGSSGSSGSSRSSTGSTSAKLPAIKHVFVIMLSTQPFASVFGPSSPAQYIAQTLEHRGELLVRYYGVAHGPLANGIALLSGQGPTVQTVAGCPTFADIVPGTAGAKEQVAGEGCVYPSATKTLISQLARKHLKVRAYVQGINEGAATSAACGHPALGAPDPTAAPSSASPYTTPRNPFVYFHSVIDGGACAGEDVGLAALARDLRSAASTPALSYIVPDRCDDAGPSPCAPGAPAGLAAAVPLLQRVVPEILASGAYKKDGLLIITVDGAPVDGELADSSACCGQPRFPNLPPPTGKAALLGAEGGGQVGALLLSPFVKGGSVSQEPYNHFSLLRTIEDLFGVPHLGYAALPKVLPLEPALFARR